MTATCRSFLLNPNGSPQLFLYEGQIPRWRSGHCNGLRWTGVPILQVRINFNISFVNNDDKLTIMWGVRNRSIFSRLVVDEPGSVQRFTWHEQIAKLDFFLSPAQYDKKSRGFLSKKGMLAGLVLSIAAGVFFVILFSFWLIKRKKTETMLSFNESPEEETSLRDKPINDTSGVLSASVSWKSIDHPTNTMLLFATLGRMDRKTDHQVFNIFEVPE
ncbi:hypothetical protein POTOM_016526 [Populus tomentosa]|uniref:S-locus glycoprotein domain-containing protein n=1 Tax=Populus tomentosa TaxID=118781 RepID=A0A8X8D3C4_POPTO|nr:hypothetical protein POTOM_016526 [Populus tomentosa]